MRRTRRLLFLAMVSAALLSAGCEVEELQRVDRIVADVNDVFAGAAEVTDGPARRLIPEPWRTAIGLLGFVGAAAVAVWEKIRASRVLEKNADLTLTTRAIVQGIEAAELHAKDSVKPAIADRMKQLRIYDTADPIVENLKKGA